MLTQVMSLKTDQAGTGSELHHPELTVSFNQHGDPLEDQVSGWRIMVSYPQTEKLGTESQK